MPIETGMKRLILIALVLSGCVAQAKSIIWTDGKPAYALRCSKGKARCYQGITAACPNGYDFVEDENGGTAGGHSAFAYDRLNVRDVVFRCKGP